MGLAYLGAWAFCVNYFRSAPKTLAGLVKSERVRSAEIVLELVFPTEDLNCFKLTWLAVGGYVMALEKEERDK